MSNMPDVKVEIAFDSGVLTPAASRTWTDVSDWVEFDQGISIRRGRSDEFQVTSPSTLAVTFDNTDGRFTPGNASSPYYPNVKIGRPIRVVVDPAGDASVRFTGYVDEWPVEWPEGADTLAHAAVTATSRLARLGEGAELKSVVMTEILADDPVAYYPMGEPEGAYFSQEYTGSDQIGMYSHYGGGVAWGLSDGLSTDNQYAVQVYPELPDTQIRRLAAYYLNHPTTEVTLETFIALGTANEGESTSILSLWSGDLNQNNDYKSLEVVAVHGATTVMVGGYTEAVGGTYNDNTPAAIISGLYDGQFHHVALTYVHDATASVCKMYLDGELVASGSGGTFGATIPDSWLILAGRNRVDAGTDPTAICHIAIYNQALSADRIEAHALAGLEGFASETAGPRIERIAGYADIPTVEVAADTGDAPISHIDTSGATVDSLLRTVETTDGGVLFDARDGSLAYHDRSHRYGSTAAFTLNVDAQEIEAEGFRPILDRTAITNEMAAKSLDGTLEQRFSDATSATDYGQHRQEVTLATTDVDQLYQAAAWRVSRYKEPRTRFASLAPVDVVPLGEALRDAIRDADISTRFALANLPGQAPSDVTEFFVEGITETLGVESWRFEFNASPANVVDDLFVIGTSTLNGSDVLAY